MLMFPKAEMSEMWWGYSVGALTWDGSQGKKESTQPQIPSSYKAIDAATRTPLPWRHLALTTSQGHNLNKHHQHMVSHTGNLGNVFKSQYIRDVSYNFLFKVYILSRDAWDFGKVWYWPQKDPKKWWLFPLDTLVLINAWVHPEQLLVSCSILMISEVKGACVDTPLS